jgi:adenine deaminase
MLVPSEFAKIAVKHGTVATVSDPHEIANVLGVKGVDFMIENGKKVPLKFNFGAPSCVPATSFESAGAIIDAADIQLMMENPDIKYLAEMMNYPGVLFDDAEVLAKIQHAKKNNKPIDGHAPGLRGEDATKYIAAGISTDHECFTYDEALEKLQKGMKVIIREGSAAKNFEALIDLLPEYFENMMFCSDDKHPDDLLLGHINQLCERAVAKGIDVFKVLQAACVNPVKHYNLEVGLLKKGDAADFILVDNLEKFNVLETYINGVLVAKNGESFVKSVPFEVLNNFNTDKKKVSDFRFESSANKIRVIEALDGELVTNQIEADSLIVDGNLVSNTATDVLKMTVVNRYKNEEPSIAFIKNFGIKEGAIASSVGHDSHNIIAIGVSDEAICKAVNLVIENSGGVCAVNASEEKIVSLPVAGIMSDLSAEEIGKAYAELDTMAKQMGSKLSAPYMSLSFMALLVIPSLKLSDKGLFDGTSFKFTSLEIA